MRRKVGSTCICLGTALILAALSLFLWNRYEEARAGNAVDSTFAQLQEKVKDAADAGISDLDLDGGMTEVEIDGYSYIGYLSIPSLGLELPVMSDWSYSQLKLSPCRYSGSTKTDDLVIAAHNYVSHFGPIKHLKAGDSVYFTDIDGVMFSYEVAETDILSPFAVEEMIDSGYALTLFTCSYGGTNRVTVRCEWTGIVKGS